MKNVFRSFVALAASLLAFSACDREVLPEVPAETHCITFVANAPQTRTSASIDTEQKTVDFSWSESDKTRFSVYEILGDTYTPATTVSAKLIDGSMVLSAKFSGAATPNAKYVAMLNTGVQANQESIDGEYDQESDVLISEVVTSNNIENETLLLSFKRENAFALMTAKGLEGSHIGGATITATNDKFLAGEYDVRTKSFAETGSNTITIDALCDIVGGQGSVFVSTLPAVGVALNVGVVTVDDNNDFVAAFEKSFKAGSTIDFTRGDVRAFNIGMNKATSLTLDLSTDETTTASTEELSWDRTFVSVVAAKANAATNTNNYYPGVKQNSTRFYKGSTLTFTPKIGLSIKEIVYTATTEGYATVVANAAWTNATALLSGTTVTIIPEDGTQAVSTVIDNTTGATAIVISYGIPEPISSHDVRISTSIEDGDVTATPTYALPGTEITLTAAPSNGYFLDAWKVTNVSTSEDIEVVNNKFTMPNADVIVSATFKVISKSGSVTINTENSGVIGSYDNKEFTVDGITFGFTQWMKNTSIQAKASTSHSLYNTKAFPYPIKKITFVQASGKTARAIKVYGGTSAKPTAEVTAPATASTMVFDFSGKDYTYFSLTTPGNAVYFDSITIEYEPVATITSLAVSGDATKKAYKAGDKFDIAGLVATATFDDNSTKVVTDEATWTITPETLSAGTTSVSVVAAYKTVASNAFSVTDLTVTEPVTLSSISVKTAPTKVSYVSGDKFDPTGLVISKHYSDGTSDDYSYASHTSDFSFDPDLSTALTEDNTKVTITYQGKSVDLPITVTLPTFSSLEALAAADLTSGAIVKVSFENVPIKSVYVTSQGYRNGIYFNIQKGGKDIELFYQNVPEEWIVDGTVSGTMTCLWKNYNGTWELAPEKDTWSWENLTYNAPLAPCATPEITITGSGSATITCATADATIYYTVGTSPDDPSNESNPYTSAVNMTNGQIIKAIAYKDGLKPSEVSFKKYTVGDTYTLCTSASDLVAGGTYIIASGNSGTVQCISNELNSNNRKQVEATVENNKIVLGDNSTVMTLELGGSTGAWTLQTLNYAGTNGYFASASSGSNNYCRVITTETTGTITFSNNAAVITLQPHTSRNILRYNSSSSCFACYSTGQGAVYLYKKN